MVSSSRCAFVTPRRAAISWTTDRTGRVFRSFRDVRWVAAGGSRIHLRARRTRDGRRPASRPQPYVPVLQRHYYYYFRRRREKTAWTALVTVAGRALPGYDKLNMQVSHSLGRRRPQSAAPPNCGTAEYAPVWRFRVEYIIFFIPITSF